jgi:hypothetical protein
VGRGKRKEKIVRVKRIEVHYTHINTYCLQRGKEEGVKEYNGGGELVQSTLYVSMELSQ